MVIVFHTLLKPDVDPRALAQIDASIDDFTATMPGHICFKTNS